VKRKAVAHLSGVQEEVECKPAAYLGSVQGKRSVKLLLTLVVSKGRWTVACPVPVSTVRWNVRLLLTLVVSRDRWIVL
jgi:hypothetical protein